MHNNNNNENDADEEGTIVGSDVGKDAKLHCDECSQNPCDWTKYGPCLLIQINNTSMKHGYLWKRNRMPICKCVESGIRLNYPDINNTYVGFHMAEQD
jgi:hypothetical protein